MCVGGIAQRHLSSGKATKSLQCELLHPRPEGTEAGGSLSSQAPLPVCHRGICSACCPHNGAALLQDESTRLPQVFFFFFICNFLQRGQIQKREQRVMKHDTDVSSYLGHKGWKRLHTLHFIITRPGRWIAQDAHVRSEPQTRGLSDSILETRMEH